jgi:thiol-disulfide isomerase/thioredoxin
MKRTITAILITIIVLGGAALIERSIRKNKSIPKQENEESATLSENIEFEEIISGKKIKLKDLKGKVVLVNYWATWCTACVSEMPSMQKLYEALSKDGFEILGVNVDDEPKKEVPDFIKKLGIKFPVVRELGSKDLEKKLQVVAIPTSALIDKEGKLLWVESGERDWFSEVVIQEIKSRL